MRPAWTKSKAWARDYVQEADMDWAVEAAQALIQQEPVNPPGRELSAAVWIARQLESFGFDVTLDPFSDDRANVLATYGNPDDIGMALYGHIDVVPPFGTPKEPRGTIKDGFLYGRGSADMLGGCASILAAAGVLARSGFQGQKGVALLFVSDEEQFNGGMRRIFGEGMPKDKNLSAIAQADAAIVAEPTNLQVQLGNRGFTSFYIRTHGKAAHSSVPQDGENAIYKMAPILSRLQQFCKDLDRDSHPWLGPSTLNVGTIRGGVIVNTIPDFCEIEVERRILPGTTPDMAFAAFQKLVGEEAEVIRRSSLYASWIEEDHAFTQTALDAVAAFSTEEPKVAGFIGCTEAGFFSERLGIPTILLGPGSISEAHRETEFCKLSQIRECVSIFTALTHFYMR